MRNPHADMTTVTGTESQNLAVEEKTTLAEGDERFTERVGFDLQSAVLD